MATAPQHVTSLSLMSRDVSAWVDEVAKLTQPDHVYWCDGSDAEFQALERELIAAQELLPFWKRKSLAQMSKQEWESLCDGCGMCCVNKLEYEGTGELAQTDTCCKLLDPKTARCRDYKNRKKIVPDCIQLSPKVVAKMDWLPKTCGYRLVHLKQDLYWWHPLVSGDPETVHQAGISARGRVIPEDQVEDISERVVDWFA